MAIQAEQLELLKPLTSVTSCKVCKGSNLTWDTYNKTNPDVQDGRLRSHDVKCFLFLGCDNCSETLAIVSADQVAVILTSMMTAATAAAPN